MNARSTFADPAEERMRDGPEAPPAAHANAPTNTTTATKDTITAAGEALKLRVLRGRSQGAEHRLPAGRILKIGHSFENDIVLRGRETRGTALKLQIGEESRLTLEVVSGRMRVLGRELAAGETIRLTPYLPVAIGDFHFAIGRGDEARWEEAGAAACEETPPAGSGEEIPHTDLAERLALRSQPARNRLAILGGRPKLLAAAGAVLLVGGGAGLFGTSLLPSYNATPVALQQKLSAAGFGTLGVKKQAGGVFAITGLVADDTMLGRLRSWTAANAPDAQIEVETTAGMAAAAVELLAAQNVDAAARPLGSNGLTIEGPFLPGDRQRELLAMIRRDLPLVRKIDFRADPTRGESDLAYFFNSPGYGAASFVDGDPGYILTEDGSRWFAGAVLPTGHRIVEIGTDTLVVERDGLRDTLIM